MSLAFGPILFFPIILLIFWLLGRWALAPLRQATLNPRPRTQFFLTDTYALTGLFLLAGLLVFGLHPGEEAMERVLVAAALWLLLTWTWWLGVRWLSFAGVRDRWRRGVTLAFSAPLAIVLFPLAVFGPLTLYGLSIPTDDAKATQLGLLISGGLIVIAVAIFLICRMMARWAVAKREDARGAGVISDKAVAT